MFYFSLKVYKTAITVRAQKANSSTSILESVRGKLLQKCRCKAKEIVKHMLTILYCHKAQFKRVIAYGSSPQRSCSVFGTCVEFIVF